MIEEIDSSREHDDNVVKCFDEPNSEFRGLPLVTRPAVKLGVVVDAVQPN